MSIKTGWQYYSQSGQEIRRKILIQLWIYVFTNYTGKETPTGLDQFNSKIRRALTDQELEKLYNEIWGLAHKYWSLPSRQLLSVECIELAEQWAVLDYDAVLEQIKQFDIKSLA